MRNASNQIQLYLEYNGQSLVHVELPCPIQSFFVTHFQIPWSLYVLKGWLQLIPVDIFAGTTIHGIRVSMTNHLRDSF